MSRNQLPQLGGSVAVLAPLRSCVTGWARPVAVTVGLNLPVTIFPVGCAGRLTSFAETGDGRYLVTLTRIARLRIVEEVTERPPYRRYRFPPEPLAGYMESAVRSGHRVAEELGRPQN